MQPSTSVLETVQNKAVKLGNSVKERLAATDRRFLFISLVIAILIIYYFFIRSDKVQPEIIVDEEDVFDEEDSVMDEIIDPDNQSIDNATPTQKVVMNTNSGSPVSGLLNSKQGKLASL